jgi:hypothetical protein
MFVKNKFATNMFVEVDGQASPTILHPPAADDILMTGYRSDDELPGPASVGPPDGLRSGEWISTSR